jgi:hypothetical protein
MAVEILILSGARQGDRLVLDGRQFQVGSDPACDVCFDPQRDRGIQGRSAVFRLQDDGWHVRSSGGEVLVNQQPVVGWMRLRSGDLVRMSQSGPDFSFGIVAATAMPAKAPPAAYAVAAPVFDASSVPLPTLEIAPALPPNRLGTNSQPAEPPLPPAALPPLQSRAVQPWAIWAGVALAACLLLVLLVRAMFTTPTVIVNVGQPGTPPVASSLPASPSVAAVESKPSPESGRSEANDNADHQQPPKKKPPEPIVPPADKATKPADERTPPADIASQLSDAVFLIQVEKSGRMWPFATCVAVGNDTLLTTAREAAQLAAWTAEKGFKVWITRQAGDFKEEVQDIRVHGVYAALPEKSNDWIYCDLGLLTVRAKLPKTVALASPQDMADLEEGLPVFCFGFTHEGEKTTRFDKFEPRLSQGKVYVITVSQNLPGKPRLLHVKAEIPKFAHGSPVVNAQGRLLGIYGESATPPAGADVPAGSPEVKNMHYVSVASPELIKLWLQDRSNKLWVPAAAAPAASRPQDN